MSAGDSTSNPPTPTILPRPWHSSRTFRRTTVKLSRNGVPGRKIRVGCPSGRLPRCSRIDLELIREYQQERRKQISPTMRKAISPRSINYEVQLLRGVMQHANCWKGDLAERYKPLKESKSRAGKPSGQFS